MYRPHGNLDGKCRKEGKEDPDLSRAPNRQLMPVEDREAPTRLHKQVNHRHQEQQGSHQRKQEKLECRIDAIWPAPNTDDQVQGNERCFEEDVEQHAVKRGKNTIQQPGHDEEPGVVLCDLAVDHFPAGQYHDDRDETVQDNEQHRDPIDSEMVVNVESWNPRRQLDELHCRRCQIELRIKRHGNQQTCYRA
jgi:hypothetical protein